MIRVLLTVLLAAALVGASLPAIEDARAARAARTAERDAATLRAAATELVRESDPVPRGIGGGTGVAGARVSVRVRVPAPTFAGAGLTYLAIGSHPSGSLRADGPESDAVVYRIGDRPPRVLALPVDLRAIRGGRLRGDAVPLVLRGDERLALGYARVDDGSAVTVARRSVRNFKSENATSRAHARA